MSITTSIKKSIPPSIKTKLTKLIYPQIDSTPESIKPAFEFWIDIVSGCNLRCAACPVGMPEFSNSIGQQLIEPEPVVDQQESVIAELRIQ